MDVFHSTRRFVARIPGIGLTQVVPNTVGFMASSWWRSRQVPAHPALPAAPLSPKMALHVALDETLLGIMRSPRSHPHRADYTRVGEELQEALALYRSRGWIDDPRSYHRRPPTPEHPARMSKSSRGLRYEQLSWESGYEPYPGEPGGDRWMDFTTNRRAHAYLVRAEQPTDRWMVCIHGFGMGTPLSDFHAFRAKKLAHQLGCNVALPVLPLHGPRKATLMSGTSFMSFEMMNPVFGLAQTAWDTRALLDWLEQEEGARRFGVYGISLGGYAASLLTGLDSRFEVAVAGIPATDFPALVHHHSPASLRQRALDYGMLGEIPGLVHRVVSPMAVEPLVPHSGRYIYAALGDRMSTARQAHRLWLHWGEPTVEWLPGAHVSSVLNPAVDRFVTGALMTSRFAPAAENLEIPGIAELRTAL